MGIETWIIVNNKRILGLLDPNIAKPRLFESFLVAMMKSKNVTG
jgi:hypothetical protein